MMPGPADRQHVGGADGRADDAGAPVELLRHDRLQPLGQPVLVLALGIAAGADVAEVDGERQEHAARMVDAAERRVRDQDQALLAAVVGMRAPADVGEQAGGVAQAPLVVGLLRARRLEQGVRPGAQLDGVLGRPRPQAGVLGAEGQQRVLAALGLRQQAVEQALADAEDREVAPRWARAA